MRSRVVRTALFLLGMLPPGLAAQVQPRSQPQPRNLRAAVGAEVGYSRTTLGGPDAGGLRSRQGALTGVFLQVPLNRLLSLRPEVLFALKGGRARATVNDRPLVPLDIELAYMEFPILLRAGTRGTRFRPLLFAGPAPAFRIGCDLQVVDPELPIRATCDAASVVPFSSFDIGLVAGGGLEMRFPRSSLSLEARYTTGMRSVLSDVDVRNRAFAVVLALTF